MPRFDVYASPIVEERRHTPYWLDVQADHLAGLATRIIVPLRKQTATALTTADLSPVFEVAGTRVYADTANIASFPRALLKQPVANVRDHRMAIEDALDFLLTGF